MEKFSKVFNLFARSTSICSTTSVVAKFNTCLNPAQKMLANTQEWWGVVGQFSSETLRVNLVTYWF